MINTIIVNVDELWLKGGNRPQYFKAINLHLRDVAKAYHGAEFTCLFENHRQVLHSETPFRDELLDALRRVPGVHSIIPARRVAFDLEAIFPAIKEELSAYEKLPSTFRVTTKRSNKNFPLNSMEVSRLMGGEILKNFPGLKVDVHEPKLHVKVSILDKYIYVSSRSLMAMGGLPWGMTGRLVTLISGGFDSPVASYLMSKRGCDQVFAFFYAYPFVGEEVKEKIFNIMKVIGRYQRFSKLYVVPFGHLQKTLANACREEYRTILFRHYMVSCANLIAEETRAEGLLTGDAIGQVSSQTIGNLAMLDSFSERPILRPLVGFNKAEIIELSRQIGTHDVSVVPHDDACALFAPKHPIIRPDVEYVRTIADQTDLKEALLECFKQAELYTVSLKGEIERVK